MIFKAIYRSFHGLFDQRSRSLIMKSLGLTILLFLGVWFGVQILLETFLFPFLGGWTWTITLLTWITGVGIVIGGAFLVGPVTALFAGLFLDDLAEDEEAHYYPDDGPGKPLKLVPSLSISVKYGFVVLAVNIVALLLVWLAGFGFIIFLLANGFLLGREYFQFAALRFMEPQQVKLLRDKYSFEVFLSGMCIAGFMSIPILNFLTPVFATKMMVHVFKALELKQSKL